MMMLIIVNPMPGVPKTAPPGSGLNSKRIRVEYGNFTWQLHHSSDDSNQVLTHQIPRVPSDEETFQDAFGFKKTHQYREDETYC